MPLKIKFTKPMFFSALLQQGWGEQEWETVLQLAAFAPIRLGDVTALLEIAPQDAQRLLDTMVQARALEEKEGWYQIK